MLQDFPLLTFVMFCFCQVLQLLPSTAAVTRSVFLFVRPVPVSSGCLTRAIQIITVEKKGWFYHRALLFDVNGDGSMDIVTARATAPGKEQQVEAFTLQFCAVCRRHRFAGRVGGVGWPLIQH